MSRPTLRHLQVDGLIAAAGRDPWAIDDNLWAGNPTQIYFLAQAFHQAGQSTAVADATSRLAREHFQKYQREDGGQPNNDGAEVARVKDWSHTSTEQLGQTAAADDISTLNFNPTTSPRSRRSSIPSGSASQTLNTHRRREGRPRGYVRFSRSPDPPR